MPVARAPKRTPSKTVLVRSTITVWPRMVSRAERRSALRLMALTGPSSEVETSTRVALPLLPSSATVPLILTAMPGPRSSSLAVSPSMVISASSISKRTPLTKTLPAPSMVPELVRPVPMMPWPPPAPPPPGSMTAAMPPPPPPPPQACRQSRLPAVSRLRAGR